MGWGHLPKFHGYRSAEQWNKLGMTGKRLSFTDDEIVTKLAVGYIANQGNECAMDAAIRFTLLDAGENAEINAKQMLNPYTRLAALVEENIMADGWYRSDNGEVVRGWVVATDYRPLWTNGMCSSWGSSKPHFGPNCISTAEEVKQLNQYSWGTTNTGSYYARMRIATEDNLLTTIPVKGNERMLMNHLEDKVVLRAINKSLNRMVKSEKALQVTAGRGRTFRWDEWNWLDTIRNKRLVTMAKQRKLGDIVNGWKFTKGHTTSTYGVEVCEHAWEAVDELAYWRVQLIGGASGGVWLNAFFLDGEEGQAFVDSLPAIPLGGYPVHKDNDGKAVLNSYHLSKRTSQLVLKPELMIEELPTPSEMFKRAQLGPKEYYDKVRNELSTLQGRQQMSQRITNY